jgi:hypothetical protein
VKKKRDSGFRLRDNDSASGVGKDGSRIRRASSHKAKKEAERPSEDIRNGHCELRTPSGGGVIDGRNRLVKSSPTLLLEASFRFAGLPGKE